MEKFDAPYKFLPIAMILPDGTNTAGIDECGRGSVAMNVVAAAVILPDVTTLEGNNDTWKKIRDSKKLSPAQREKLSEYIKSIAIGYGIGEATPEEIDRDNILQATLTAMHRACDELRTNYKTEITKIMVDGTQFRRYHNIPYECVVKGDDKVLSIAAASILAKHYHDTCVKKKLEEHPELGVYGLATNMGYGTKEHLDAIKKYGATPYHRKTFLKKYLESSGDAQV